MLNRVKQSSHLNLLAICAVALAGFSALAYAQDDGKSGAESQPKPAADEVLSDMLQDMESPGEAAPQPVEGDAAERAQTPGEGVERRAVVSDVTAADVQGVAPDLAQTQLRREGEFVVNRVGRLVYASESSLPLFAFSADSQSNPEPPMAMMPCQLLETMERIVSDNAGQSPQFTVTGQVFVYHGRNYLLPTLMRQSIDRGNLEP